MYLHIPIFSLDFYLDSVFKELDIFAYNVGKFV